MDLTAFVAIVKRRYDVCVCELSGRIDDRPINRNNLNVQNPATIIKCLIALCVQIMSKIHEMLPKLNRINPHQR